MYVEVYSCTSRLADCETVRYSTPVASSDSIGIDIQGQCGAPTHEIEFFHVRELSWIEPSSGHKRKKKFVIADQLVNEALNSLEEANKSLVGRVNADSLAIDYLRKDIKRLTEREQRRVDILERTSFVDRLKFLFTKRMTVRIAVTKDLSL